MNQNEKVKLLAKDFSKTTPRSARETLGGYVIAARTLDKCRSVLAGTEDEYHFDCPLAKTALPSSDCADSDWGQQPVLLRRFMAFFRALEWGSSPIAPDLRALITVRVSQINHCAFCVDFNSKRVLPARRLSARTDFDCA